MPANVAEYHDMVTAVLSDDDLNRRFRQRGREAVMKRHTYAHRARSILEYLGIAPPPECRV
jgi:hypothetical protein